jgi:hypothetical protein
VNIAVVMQLGPLPLGATRRKQHNYPLCLTSKTIKRKQSSKHNNNAQNKHYETLGSVKKAWGVSPMGWRGTETAANNNTTLIYPKDPRAKIGKTKTTMKDVILKARELLVQEKAAADVANAIQGSSGASLASAAAQWSGPAQTGPRVVPPPPKPAARVVAPRLLKAPRAQCEEGYLWPTIDPYASASSVDLLPRCASDMRAQEWWANVIL